MDEKFIVWKIWRQEKHQLHDQKLIKNRIHTQEASSPQIHNQNSKTISSSINTLTSLKQTSYTYTEFMNPNQT
jgi:hypothetical protein